MLEKIKNVWLRRTAILLIAGPVFVVMAAVSPYVLWQGAMSLVYRNYEYFESAVDDYKGMWVMVVGAMRGQWKRK